MNNYPSNSAISSNNKVLNALLMTIPSLASEPSGPTNSWPPYSGYQEPQDTPRSRQTDVSDDDPLKWVTRNWENVTKRFPNQWIVVEKGGVVAHSETASDLRNQIKRLGIECPFITKTGQGPIVWRTAYGSY
jgi:hypothetical protein